MNKPSNKVPNWTNKTKKRRTWSNFFSGSPKPLPSTGLTYRNQKGKIIPKPSFLRKNKTQKGGVPEYLLRAANMLSERSRNTRNANLKILNKTNRNNLRKLLGKTRKNNRNQ